ncbi:hypothetical protein AVEN_171522-1 [Araneus ventricosus]|uniref:Uncharacterized protein n=1 Tax=Araneus ventricosus TaxID=182803 RepID=A0A4Y2LHN5_ARAVE|nr:hypothetical protein AVEN_171522-1 [Araneus ventricosus]
MIIYCRALQHLRIVRAPSDKPRLIVDVPVLLIRYLDIPRLRNGTRSQITHLGPNVAKATVMTDIGRSESFLIPRLPITPKDLSSQFKREVRSPTDRRLICAPPMPTLEQDPEGRTITTPTLPPFPFRADDISGR